MHGGLTKALNVSTCQVRRCSSKYIKSVHVKLHSKLNAYDVSKSDLIISTQKLLQLVPVH